MSAWALLAKPHLRQNSSASEADMNSVIGCSEPLKQKQPLARIFLFSLYSAELSSLPDSLLVQPVSSCPCALLHTAQKRQAISTSLKLQIIYVPLLFTQVPDEQWKEFIWKSATHKNVNTRKGAHIQTSIPKEFLKASYKLWFMLKIFKDLTTAGTTTTPQKRCAGSQGKPQMCDFLAIIRNTSYSRAALSLTLL